jgi:hypothetical protein
MLSGPFSISIEETLFNFETTELSAEISLFCELLRIN